MEKENDCIPRGIYNISMRLEYYNNGGTKSMGLNERGHILKQAIKWVLDAGDMIRTKMDKPIQIETKSNPNDLVTSVDKETESFLIKRIQAHYPDHALLGEEGHGAHITSLDGTIWIIDPIDGTMNFVHQKRHFAISIGIFHDGIGEIGIVYDVMADTLYYASKGEGAFKNNNRLEPLNDQVQLEKSIIGLNHLWLCENKLVDEKVMQKLVKTVRGVRSSGSAALDMAYVAEGALDAYLAMGLSPWDIAGGTVLVNEVGGRTTNHLGEPLHMLKRNSLLTSRNSIHSDLIQQFLKKGQK